MQNLMTFAQSYKYAGIILLLVFCQAVLYFNNSFSPMLIYFEKAEHSACKGIHKTSQMPLHSMLINQIDCLSHFT